MVRGRPLRRRRLKIVRLSFALICVVGASLLLPVVAALLRMMCSQSLCVEVNNFDAGRHKEVTGAPLCLQGWYVTVMNAMAPRVGNSMENNLNRANSL